MKKAIMIITITALLVAFVITACVEKIEVDCTGHEGDNVWLGHRVVEEQEKVSWYKSVWLTCKETQE